MKYFSILLTSLLFSSSVIAIPDIKETPGYEVEILVFKNLQIEEENELWVQDIDPNSQSNLDNATPVGGGVPADSEIRKAFEKMFESGKYLFVTHKRWIQDAIPKSEAQLIRIANAEAGLDGTVRFYKNRFLHLDINLMLSEEFVPVSGNDTSTSSDAQENTQNYFIIKEQRRIRSKNLNYFDHPRFGVLIQVNRIKISTQ